MNQKKLRAAVEAMLFAYAEPIGADKLAQALQMPVSSVEPVLEELRTRYAREDSGLCLLHLNTHWQLATKADFAEPVRRVLDTRIGRKAPAVRLQWQANHHDHHPCHHVPDGLSRHDPRWVAVLQPDRIGVAPLGAMVLIGIGVWTTNTLI